MFLQVSNLLVTPFFKSVQKHQLWLHRYNSLCPHCFPLTYSMSDETVSLMDLRGFSRIFYFSLFAGKRNIAYHGQQDRCQPHLVVNEEVFILRQTSHH
jgi:hypothetical protein